MHFAKNVSLAFDRKSQLKGSCRDGKSSVCSVGEFFHELQYRCYLVNLLHSPVSCGLGGAECCTQLVVI